MFKTRKQLKQEIADLEILLDASDTRYENLLKEATSLNAKHEEERRELCNELEDARRAAELEKAAKDAAEIKCNAANEALSRCKKELEEAKRKLSRKHCDTVAKKWKNRKKEEQTK